MDFIDLSNSFPKTKEDIVPFESKSLEQTLGEDPYNQISGWLIPSKDKNHQTFIAIDRRGSEKGKFNPMKLYQRQRKDKDAKWDEWEFIGIIN